MCLVSSVQSCLSGQCWEVPSTLLVGVLVAAHFLTASLSINYLCCWGARSTLLVGVLVVLLSFLLPSPKILQPCDGLSTYNSSAPVLDMCLYTLHCCINLDCNGLCSRIATFIPPLTARAEQTCRPDHIQVTAATHKLLLPGQKVRVQLKKCVVCVCVVLVCCKSLFTSKSRQPLTSC